MIREGYPLQFPVGRPRTTNPKRASFGNHSIHQSVIFLKEEIRRLKGTDIVVSSNLMLRLDGLPYSNQRVDDQGVAVYFMLNGKEQCFPCDKWDKIEHNLWAIYMSIKAIRGLERWGAKDMLDSALKGFEALPSPENVTKQYNEHVTPIKVRYFQGINNLEEGKAIFKNLCLELHPDKGGKAEEFMELNKQFVQFKQAMGNS